MDDNGKKPCTTMKRIRLNNTSHPVNAFIPMQIAAPCPEGENVRETGHRVVFSSPALTHAPVCCVPPSGGGEHHCRVVEYTRRPLSARQLGDRKKWDGRYQHS